MLRRAALIAAIATPLVCFAWLVATLIFETDYDAVDAQDIDVDELAVPWFA